MNRGRFDLSESLPEAQRMDHSPLTHNCLMMQSSAPRQLFKDMDLSFVDHWESSAEGVATPTALSDNLTQSSMEHHVSVGNVTDNNSTETKIKSEPDQYDVVVLGCRGWYNIWHWCV